MGTTLLTVSASDNDIGENGRVQYAVEEGGVEGGGGRVGVGMETGNITLLIPLDYETVESFTVEVRREGGMMRVGNRERGR